MKMIEIDGSYQEGGGQILRTSLALSALTGKAFEITNIRKNRPKAGLRPQHLSCINAVAKLCNATVEGDRLSSPSIKFYPRSIKASSLNIDIGTAGSITLLLQCIFPIIIFSGKRFKATIVGGTDVPFSPPIDYLRMVLLPHLRKFCEIEVNVIKRGFVPTGQGQVNIKVNSKYNLKDAVDAPAFNLIDQGKLVYIKGISFSSANLPEVANKQEKSARLYLASLGSNFGINSQTTALQSTGSVITLWSLHSLTDEISQLNPVVLGGSCLGDRSLSAEEVGKNAAILLKNSIALNAPVDEHLADQLLPFLALTKGKIKIPNVTGHVISNIYAINNFLGSVLKIDNNVVLRE